MDLDMQSPYQIVAARMQITRAKLVTFASVVGRTGMLLRYADLPRPILIKGDMNTHNELWRDAIWRGLLWN